MISWLCLSLLAFPPLDKLSERTSLHLCSFVYNSLIQPMREPNALYNPFQISWKIISWWWPTYFPPIPMGIFQCLYYLVPLWHLLCLTNPSFFWSKRYHSSHFLGWKFKSHPPLPSVSNRTGQFYFVNISSFCFSSSLSNATVLVKTPWTYDFSFLSN